MLFLFLKIFLIPPLWKDHYKKTDQFSKSKRNPIQKYEFKHNTKESFLKKWNYLSKEYWKEEDSTYIGY